jgi:CheY-like chemotaxis protein
MLAHELRNPLAPLRNAVYIMQQLDLSDETLTRTRDLIDRQTAHLKRLVDDLLEVSRLELGKVNLQLTPLDLNTAIASAAEACLPATTARRHIVEVRLAPEPLTIMADAVRLEQIIGNLITNAAKFTAEGGHISIEVRSEDDSAVFAVQDSGIGLRQEMLASVFDLFTQDTRTLERAGGGLGIGLTIVKRLVGLHGGSVSVTSEGPGTGCTFSVRLPRYSLHMGERRASKAAMVAGQPKRVLLVEDNPDVCDSLRVILQLWGHQVEIAVNGDDGLKLARDLEPDLVVIDIGLPGLNGYEVARAIRQAATPWSKRVTLVALTGYGSDSDRQRALEAGFDSHLVKPVDPEVLAESLGFR